MAQSNGDPQSQTVQVISDKQLLPSFAARVLIPAGENLLVGVGVVMIVAAVWANWQHPDLPLWVLHGTRVALIVSGLLFILRFGSDEVRMLVGIATREMAIRQDKAKDEFIRRLEHENSLLRNALALRKTYTAPTTVEPETPVDDALMILARFKSGYINRVSERTVKKMKLLDKERYKQAMLVLRQANVLFDRQGLYQGMMENGRRVDNASIDAAIAAVKTKFKKEVVSEEN